MGSILEKQIDGLFKSIVKLCSLVDSQFNLTLLSIENVDKSLAEDVTKFNNRFKRFDAKIQDNIFKIMLGNQLFGSKLRLLFSCFDITSNLTRASELITYMSSDVEKLDKKFHTKDIKHYNDHSLNLKNMLNKAFDSLIQRDTKLALEVIFKIKDFENQNDELSIHLLSLMKSNPTNLENYLVVKDFITNFKKLGNITAKLAQCTLFLVEGNLSNNKIAEQFAEFQSTVATSTPNVISLTGENEEEIEESFDELVNEMKMMVSNYR